MTKSLLAVCLFLCALPAVAAEEGYPLSIPVPAGAPAPAYKRLTAVSRDGVKLAVHEWAPARRPAGAPVALFLHGIGMHGEPYGSVAAGFTARGIAFLVPDLRGHGRSDGPRGELAAPALLRTDIGAVFALVLRRYPDAPVFLLGDSMGGVIAADYAWRGEQRLAGLALLVPAFSLGRGPWERPGGDVRNLLTTGHIALANEAKMGPSTQSPGFLRARLADPLALAEVKLSYLTTIAGMQAEWHRAAADIKVPLLVCVAGKDQIVDNAVTRRFFDRAGTPREDKVWLPLPGAHHTVCWDPATPEFVAELAKWMLRTAK